MTSARTFGGDNDDKVATQPIVTTNKFCELCLKW